MFRKIGIVAVVLFHFVGGALLRAEELQTATIGVEAGIKPTTAGIEISYRLSAPVAAFRFDHSVEGDGDAQAIPIRRDYWTIKDKGFVFDGLTLKRSDGAGFKNFTVIATPDLKDYDRVYTALFRMDHKAYGFYTRHFIGDTETFETAFCIQYEGTCSTEIFDAAGPEIVAEGSFLLLGDFPVQKIGSISVMVSPLLPVPVAKEMLQALIDNIAIYETTFGFPAPEKASVFLSYDPGNSGYRGGVAAGASVYLQLRGPMALMEESTIQTVKEFVAHEVVHFWNGELFDSADNASQSWLHEGGANYFAVAATWPEGALYKKASEWLAGCQKFRTDKPLDGSAGQVAGQAPYQCGAFIHWLLNEDLRRISDNQIDVGRVWKTMFQRASKNGDNEYSAKMFEETVFALGGKTAWQTVQPILIETDKKRWLDLADTLAKFGYRTEAKKAEDFSAFDLMGPVFFGFLNAECGGGPFSFYFNIDHLKFENDHRCGAMSGDFIVRTLDGINIFSEPARAFHQVQQACIDKLDVVFSDFVGGKSISVKCKAEPPMLPKRYKLIHLAAD